MGVPIQTNIESAMDYKYKQERANKCRYNCEVKWQIYIVKQSVCTLPDSYFLGLFFCFFITQKNLVTKSSKYHGFKKTQSVY